MSYGYSGDGGFGGPPGVPFAGYPQPKTTDPTTLLQQMSSALQRIADEYILVPLLDRRLGTLGLSGAVVAPFPFFKVDAGTARIHYVTFNCTAGSIDILFGDVSGDTSSLPMLRITSLMPPVTIPWNSNINLLLTLRNNDTANLATFSVIWSS